MTKIDIDRLSPEERLELIGRLWDSLDDKDLPLTPEQEAELDHRLATADADLADTVPWQTCRAELRTRYK